MIVCVTGHRPERLGSVDAMANSFGSFLINEKVDTVLVGMAEGADIQAAWACRVLGVPYHAVRPFYGHVSGPHEEYFEVLGHAEKVTVLDWSQTYPGPHVYHNRNRYMVDNSEAVFAAWDGQQRGGTWQTIVYARSQGKRIYRFNVVDPGASGWLPK